MSRKRYVAMLLRPRSDWEDWIDDPQRPNLTVYEPSDEPRDTGLLDASGTPLYAIEVRDRIGFLRFDDED